MIPHLPESSLIAQPQYNTQETISLNCVDLQCHVLGIETYFGEITNDEVHPDLMAILLNQDGQMEKVDDLIFYNNLSSREKAVVLEGDNMGGGMPIESDFMNICFEIIPSEIRFIRLVLCIYQPSETKDQMSFNQVEFVKYRFYRNDSMDNGIWDNLSDTLLQRDIQIEKKDKTIIEIGCFEKDENNNWHYSVEEKAFSGSTQDYLNTYNTSNWFS